MGTGFREWSCVSQMLAACRESTGTHRALERAEQDRAEKYEHRTHRQRFELQRQVHGLRLLRWQRANLPRVHAGSKQGDAESRKNRSQGHAPRTWRAQGPDDAGVTSRSTRPEAVHNREGRHGSCRNGPRSTGNRRRSRFAQNAGAANLHGLPRGAGLPPRRRAVRARHQPFLILNAAARGIIDVSLKKPLAIWGNERWSASLPRWHHDRAAGAGRLRPRLLQR